MKKLIPNMTLNEAVEMLLTHSDPQIADEVDRLLGDPNDIDSGSLKLAIRTVTEHPPASLIDTVALCKTLVEMGIFVGFLMFSPDHGLKPTIPIGKAGYEN